MAAFRRITALLAREDVTVSGDAAQFLLADSTSPAWRWRWKDCW